jgi:SAM-dependent methyltransferase
MQKETYIWGAGYYGVLTALDLENKGVRVKGFIDKNAKTIKTRLGLPVQEPDILNGKYVIIAVKNENAVTQIKEYLVENGLKDGIDFKVSNASDFLGYVRKERWISYYHQINEIVLSTINASSCQCSILEVGSLMNMLRVICKEMLHYNYESMDIMGTADHIGSVTEMPFPNEKYDIVVCFQTLEHLPFENFEKALSELFRVAKKSVIISLPDAGKYIKLHIPGICEMKLFKRPFSKAIKHEFNKKDCHYWEINKKGYEIKKIVEAIIRVGKKYNYRLDKSYRIWENPYHHFFILTNYE